MIIPYGMIGGLWYGIKYLLIERDILGFIYELSTLSFWMEHKGAWYVAMLIPVYLLYPFYYHWLEKGSRGLKTVISCILTGIVMHLMLFMAPDVYAHLSAILASLIWFMIGTYIGKPIREKRFHDSMFFVAMLLIVLQKVVPVISSWKLVELFTYGATSVVAAYLLIVAFELFTLERIQNVFGFLGKLSLELYLTNIFLLQAYEYFGIRDYLIEYYGFGFLSMTLPQITILMLGILLSMGFRALQKNMGSM